MIRPIDEGFDDGPDVLVNQRFPSGPAAIPVGQAMVLSLKIVTIPDGVIRPTDDEENEAFVNHTFPSGPAVIFSMLVMEGELKIEMTPAGVMRPIECFASLTNQRFPSGPLVTADGVLTPEYWETG